VSIQVLNGTRRIGLVHLHEAEAARPTGFTIRRLRHLFDGAVVAAGGIARFARAAPPGQEKPGSKRYFESRQICLSKWEREKQDGKSAITAAAAATPFSTTTTATAAIATATAAAASAWLILGFIDAQRASAQIVTIQVLNGTRRIGLVHLHEAEAARPTGLTIRRQRHFFYCAVLAEQRR
jgi:hypothetical protein